MEIKAKCKSYELSATSYKCPEAQNSSLVACHLKDYWPLSPKRAKRCLPLTPFIYKKVEPAKLLI